MTSRRGFWEECKVQVRTTELLQHLTPHCQISSPHWQSQDHSLPDRLQGSWPGILEFASPHETINPEVSSGWPISSDTLSMAAQYTASTGTTPDHLTGSQRVVLKGRGAFRPFGTHLAHLWSCAYKKSHVLEREIPGLTSPSPPRLAAAAHSSPCACSHPPTGLPRPEGGGTGRNHN